MITGAHLAMGENAPEINASISLKLIYQGPNRGEVWEFVEKNMHHKF